MLKSAGQELVQDPLVALEEEEIKKVNDEIKKLKKRIDRFEVNHSDEELSKNALYIALVSRLTGLKAQRSEARRERLEAQARKNPAVAAAAIEELATVCHMQSQHTRPIRVPDSFPKLTIACAQPFRMELFQHGAHFKLYTFPSNSSSVGHLSERQRIAEDNYAERLAAWQANAHTPPCIYVWSERQHDHCPNADDLRDDEDDGSCPTESLSDLRRRMSRASGYRCLACGHTYETTTAANSLELCPLLMLEEINDVDVDIDAQIALYVKCGLLHVHDVYNTVLLCSTCRAHFDQHWLGIQEVGNTYTFRWVVKTALRSTRLPHCSRDMTYGTLHDTEVVFPFVVPVRMAIAHRHQRFVSTRSKAGKRKAYAREPQLDFESFAATLRTIGYTTEDTSQAFWNMRVITGITVSPKKPLQGSDFQPIDAPSEGHVDAMFWYSESVHKVWVKWKG
eukprot:gene13690-9805_t